MSVRASARDGDGVDPDAPTRAAGVTAPRALERVSLATVRGVAATIEPEGVSVAIGPHRLRMSARSLGRRGARAHALESRRPELHGEEARIARGAGVVEWWRTLASGLEHGFTLREPPAGAGEVEIALAIDGDLRAALVRDAVRFEAAGGDHVATYDGLVVLDADGRRLDARFDARGDAIVLVFDDREASYPVVVDPMLYGQAQRLVESPIGTGSEFGRSVAVSGDGQRILVGQAASTSAPQPAGAAFVFVRTGGTFVLEQKLLPTGGASGDLFGRAVGISLDGSRVAIGAPADDLGGTTDRGMVYVFLRTGSTWAQEAALAASDDADGDSLGWSLGISDDGSRIVAGAYFKSGGGGATTAGAAYVFARSGVTWSQEGKLVATDFATGDQLGTSVAIAGDGTRAVAGAPFANSPLADAGALYVFARSGSTWSQERKLVPTNSVAGSRFGVSVALDASGTRVAGGASYEAGPSGSGITLQGAAYVFSRNVTTWTEEARFSGSRAGDGDFFGSSIDLDASGSTVAVGALADESATGPSGSGAAYLLTRAGTTWGELAMLTSDDAAANDTFGSGIGLSDDAATLSVGAYGKSSTASSTGVAYVFLRGGIGAPCGGASDCTGGACVDGVCCDSACGASAADDCMACARALTGVADGTCAPLSAAMAPGVPCRPAADLCDVVEVCTHTSVACPTDARANAGTTCRGVAGPCDVAETCDGSSVACPPDVFLTGTSCRASGGACDLEEFCSGTAASCPGDSKVPASTICRPSIGGCDPDERCDGASNACPGDVLSPVSAPCRAAVLPCDVPESCQGTAFCPPDGFAPPTTPCRGAASQCDVAEFCTGASPACPGDALVSDGTSCDDGLTCSQTSQCQAGACQPALSLDCSDGSACTTDTCAEPAGCTHTIIAACIDAGTATDAGTAADSGTPADAGAVVPTARGGCSCGVGRASTEGSLAWIGFVSSVVALRALRRPARRRARSPLRHPSKLRMRGS